MPFSLNINTAPSPILISASPFSAQKQYFIAVEDDTRSVVRLTPQAHIYIKPEKTMIINVRYNNTLMMVVCEQTEIAAT